MTKAERKKKMEDHIAACEKEHNITFIQAVIINRIDMKLNAWKKAVDIVEKRRKDQIEKFQDMNRAEMANHAMTGD